MIAKRPTERDWLIVGCVMTLRFQRQSAILCVLTFLITVGCTKAHNLTYDVTVTNHRSGPIDDVKVEFQDKTWQFNFGQLLPNDDHSATYVGVESMPPIARKISINWRDESGSVKSVDVPVPDNICEAAKTKSGDLTITISDENTATVAFK